MNVTANALVILIERISTHFSISDAVGRGLEKRMPDYGGNRTERGYKNSTCDFTEVRDACSWEIDLPSRVCLYKSSFLACPSLV